MAYMFSESFLNTIDVSSFDMSSVEGTGRMFFQCEAKTGYARSLADATKLNSTLGKPAGLVFIVK